MKDKIFSGVFLTAAFFMSLPLGAAMAAHVGDHCMVPEPVSTALFLTGGAAMAAKRFFNRKKMA